MNAIKSFRRGRGRALWLVGATLIAAAAFGAVFVASSGAFGGAPCPTPGNFEIDGDLNQNTCSPGANDWDTPSLSVQSTTQGGTYSTSSKDPADPSSDPSTWTSAGATPDKTNFQRAYATSEVINGHFFVFVAWTRTSNTGTQGYGIEVTNAASSTAGDGTPQPNRSNGGAVFFLNTQGASAPAFLQACSYTSGADYCSSPTSSDANFTAATNPSTITDPLNGGASIDAGGFFEVALDVTGLTGITPSCPGAAANTVYLRSYTGQIKNGNLKGYMAPLEIAPDSTCVPPPITTTATPGGSTNPIGTAQHDEVTVGTQAAPGVGTVKFFLCSPSEVTANGGDCSKNGTQVGSAVTLDANGSGSSDTVNGASTPDDLAVGKYCWRAEFTPGANDHNYLAGSHTNSDTECFTVVKNTTLIGTAASSQTIGSAIHDTATLSGATAAAGGTITFQAWGPSDNPSCTGNPVFTSTVTVNGNGNYGSGDFTPTTAGKYYWIASYSGDANNQPSAGSCGDQGETSTIGKKTTLIVTAASSQTIGSAIHDVATLSGATASAGGTITFQAWGPSDNPDCSGNPLFTATVNVSGNGDYNSGDFTPTTAGKYYWIASYSGDANNLPSSGSCGDSGETSTIGKAPTGITTAATSAAIGSPVHDVATLTGATANAGGTITFNLYGPSANPDCSGAVVFTATVNVSGPGNYNSGNFTPSTAGDYYWTASYSGDVNNQPSSGTCGDQGETSSIGKQPTGITTTATSGTLGDAVHDVATLSGATAGAGGTITFNLYGPSANPDCSGAVVFTATVNVSGPGNYNSGNFTPTAAGSYYWIASYSGDGNNQPSTGSCGDQDETSTLDKRPTAIVTDATSGTLSDAVHDVATLSGATANAGGTITFNLYGPSANPDCSGAVVFTATVNVSGNGNYNSGDFTPTTAGSYYWIASYSGDGNNQPSSGTCGDQGETSTLKAPDLSITKTADNATVDAGDDLGFTVTVSNSAAPGTGIAKSVTLDDPLPGGTATDWVISPAYPGPGTCAINGPSGSQDLTCSFGDLAPGDSAQVHVSSTTDFADCTKYDNKATASSTNAPDIQDSASIQCLAPGLTVVKLTGNGTASQTVNAGDPIEFTVLVSNGGPGKATGVTLDDPLPNGTVAGWTINFQTNPGQCSIAAGTLSCSAVDLGVNESFEVDVVAATNLANCTDYDNQATAHSTNAPDAQDSASIVCNTPQPQIVTQQDPASGVIGDTYNDNATLSGTVNQTGSASITWNLYTQQNCAGSPVDTETRPVDDNGTFSTPTGAVLTKAGTYYWVATFSGDANNPSVSSGCNDEAVVVSPNSPTISTLLSSSAGMVGTTVHDSSKLAGATRDAGGTVTYTVYSNSSCSTKFADGGTVNVTNGTVPNSNAVTFNTAGTYFWQASYSGDGNNGPALSKCTDEQLVVAPLIDLAITKSGSPASQNLGDGNITWTMVVTNNGPSTATGVKVTDPMPAGNTFVSASASPHGTCTGGAILTCDLGTMPAGDKVTITLVTKPSAGGTQTNTVSVVGNETETNTANNTATAHVQVNVFTPPAPVFCVAVSKVTPNQLFVGRKTTLTIHVTKNKKAVKGIHVRIKGPKVNIKTKASNGKGAIKQVVKMKKAGVLIFTPIASKTCNTKRVGITNVFTPPVTG